MEYSQDIIKAAREAIALEWDETAMTEVAVEAINGAYDNTFEFRALARAIASERKKIEGLVFTLKKVKAACLSVDGAIVIDAMLFDEICQAINSKSNT